MKYMQESSKYYQTKFNIHKNGSDPMFKWYLSHGCNSGSISANPSSDTPH